MTRVIFSVFVLISLASNSIAQPSCRDPFPASSQFYLIAEPDCSKQQKTDGRKWWISPTNTAPAPSLGFMAGYCSKEEERGLTLYFGTTQQEGITAPYIASYVNAVKDERWGSQVVLDCNGKSIGSIDTRPGETSAYQIFLTEDALPSYTVSQRENVHNSLTIRDKSGNVVASANKFYTSQIPIPSCGGMAWEIKADKSKFDPRLITFLLAMRETQLLDCKALPTGYWSYYNFLGGMVVGSLATGAVNAALCGFVFFRCVVVNNQRNDQQRRIR